MCRKLALSELYDAIGAEKMKLYKIKKNKQPPPQKKTHKKNKTKKNWMKDHKGSLDFFTLCKVQLFTLGVIQVSCEEHVFINVSANIAW